MAEVACVPHGPDGFEALLGDAKLSEREADAVRTVVLGLTAAQAAPLIGVGASTVGSYRQRAYQKLGVSTKAEFLGLAECEEWRSSLAQEAPVEVEMPSPVGEQPRKGLGLLFLKCLAASFAIVTLIVVLSIVLQPRYSYLESPSGVVSSAYGEVPNVTGMCADAAAASLASAGYLPEFVSASSTKDPGTVLRVVEVGDIGQASSDFSSITWEGGYISGYNPGGDWKAYALIEVAV